ncbi:MAG: phosphatidylserine decarboxylase family protein [candidate division Zixibacteria bacterium]|nr:phosphatidylserine decarboxylase family protein [candidate division Zixibacteria bacterium]MDH3938447.1 phosphatidylserine decarboxylase family protein [candidate division Zixibacteria bacterium]MDH4034464.1 phosphatidylserine decarboxylase family protein [candidate division Zixibacteria bacterium]
MIVREGLSIIFIMLCLTVVVLLLASRFDSRILACAAALFALLTVFTVFFFRDPARNFDGEPGMLVSPADGRILSVEKIEHHDFIGGPAWKVSIFLSVFDVHVNRIPCTGSIDYVKYNPGKFFKAFLDKASDENEHTEIGMTTPTGQHLIVKQIAGLIARRIVCRLHPDDQVTTGARFGLIKFGSRTELLVPIDSKILVAEGDHVKGGATVIGKLVEAMGTDLSDSSQAHNVEL